MLWYLSWCAPRVWTAHACALRSPHCAQSSPHQFPVWTWHDRIKTWARLPYLWFPGQLSFNLSVFFFFHWLYDVPLSVLLLLSRAALLQNVSIALPLVQKWPTVLSRPCPLALHSTLRCTVFEVSLGFWGLSLAHSLSPSPFHSPCLRVSFFFSSSREPLIVPLSSFLMPAEVAVPCPAAGNDDVWRGFTRRRDQCTVSGGDGKGQLGGWTDICEPDPPIKRCFWCGPHILFTCLISTLGPLAQVSSGKPLSCSLVSDSVLIDQNSLTQFRALSRCHPLRPV